MLPVCIGVGGIAEIDWIVDVDVQPHLRAGAHGPRQKNHRRRDRDQNFLFHTFPPRAMKGLCPHGKRYREAR